MKNVIYELVVDVWRLASKYGFRKMSDPDWESFVSNGTRMVKRYHDKGEPVERLCRDLLDAFQIFLERR